MFTITFKNDVNSLAAGTDKTTAKKVTVIAAYKDNGGADQLIAVDLSVRDCNCGCPVNTTSGGWITFMCYNLGADPNMTIDQQIAYEPSGDTDATVFGDLYQWGRRTDGHEKRTNTGKTTMTSPTDVVVHSDYITVLDWRSPPNPAMWGATKTANDPCPAGWRVPTYSEWRSIFNDEGDLGTGGQKNDQATANEWIRKINYGSNPTGTSGFAIRPYSLSEPTLFIPSTSVRNANTGNLNPTNENGYYWGSSVDGNNSHSIYISSTNQTVNVHGFIPRGWGCSVRCVAEN